MTTFLAEWADKFLDGNGATAIRVHDLDEAIIGVGRCLPDNELRITYSVPKILGLLQDQGLTREQAREWFDFNILPLASSGASSPIFVFHPQNRQARLDELAASN